MSHLSNACLIAGLAFAAGATAQMPPDADPYAWLEDVEGARSLDWVRARNARTEAEIASTPDFKALEAQIRAILDSDAKIPGVEKIGDFYYNFWKDAQHERGVWRRTTLEEYRKPEPRWETVLDLDALNAAEGTQWVWHGADCLRPKYERCLIALSPGGSDADVTREFDLTTKQFVADGFFRPEAKGNLAWIDRDTVYAITDFGEGSTNKAGYARFVKIWKRGTPLADAVTLFEGPADNAGYGIYADREFEPGHERGVLTHYLDSRDTAVYVHGKDGRLSRIDAPDSAQKDVHRDWLLLELREPYQAGGRTYPAGALIATRFDEFMAGKREFSALFEPGANTSLAGYAWTKDHLILNVMEDVKNTLKVLTWPSVPHAADGWIESDFAGAPSIGTVAVSPVDPDHSDAVWLIATDFLTPTTLALAQVGQAPEVLKSNPVFFDGSKDVIEQHFASSKDGTRVPYFIVRPKDLKFDGKAPTLLYGYGGFEISMTPGYNGAIGKGWLEKGGVYVLANIRGGGEYGPRWHQAALQANRHKAYEDFAAIAADLVARGITSPAHLGTMGGSNGGLLMGNMLTQYPEKFGAIVIQVPLLDMKRYSHLLAGASWMAEYGDPDTDDWNFIRTFSPYHLFDPAKAYPPTLFLTSTKDDRVHPAHARKMMAKMEAAGKDVRYYENIEGGHGGAANNAQAAHMSALALTFLWNHLAQ